MEIGEKDTEERVGVLLKSFVNIRNFKKFCLQILSDDNKKLCVYLEKRSLLETVMT